MPKITHKCIGLIVPLLLALVYGKSSPCDVSRHFVCRNNASICIPLSAVRDGKADCPDNSDEDPCLPDEFQCRSNAQCIPLVFFQDGHEDCDDGSDEECREDEYTCLCGFPRCIPQSRLKDGIFDCVEGSDEVSVDEDSFSCSFLDDNDNELSNRKKRQVSSGSKFNLTNLEKSTGFLSSTVQTVVHDGLTSMMTTEMYGQNAPDGQYFRFFSTVISTIHPSIVSSIEWGEQADVDANKAAMMAKMEAEEELRKQATIFSNFYSSDHPDLLASATVVPSFPAPDWTPRETISANVFVSGKLLPSRPSLTSSKAATKKMDPIQTQRLPKGNDFVYPAYVITYTVGEEKMKKSKKFDASKATKQVTTTEMSTGETLSTAEDIVQELQEPATESSLQGGVIDPVSKKAFPPNEKLGENMKPEVHKKPLSPLHTHTVGIGEANVLPTARSRFFRPSPAIIRGNVHKTTKRVTFANTQATRKNIVKHSKITLKGFVDFTTTVSGTEIVFVPQSTNNAETTFKIQPSKSLFEQSISEINEIVDVVRDSKQDFVLSKIGTTSTQEMSKEMETILQPSLAVEVSAATEESNTEIANTEQTPSSSTSQLTSEIIGVLITSEDLSHSIETEQVTMQTIELKPSTETEQILPMQTIELKPTIETEQTEAPQTIELKPTIEEFSVSEQSDLLETIDFHNKPNTGGNPFSEMVDVGDMDLIQPEDEFPLGIISSTEGVLESDGTTTQFTTIIIGTFIEGNYAQVIQSTSSLLHTITVEEDVPSQTEYTTYTHYSTIIKDNFPSIVSSFDTVSNVVPDNIKSEIQPSLTIKSEDATTFTDFNVVNGLFPSVTSDIHIENGVNTEVIHFEETSAALTKEDQLMTTFSTFTHYTTITRGNFPFVTSNVEIMSQVLVLPTIDAVNEISSAPSLPETQLTTLTAFTTETQLPFPSVVTSQETITNIVQDSKINISEEPIASTPQISVSPIMGTLLFTSYSTILRGDISTVTSIVVTSTLPVAEVVHNESITTIPLIYQTIIRNNPSKTEETIELPSKDTQSFIEQVSASAKTMFTTLTQFVTSYNGNFPSVSSSTIVISNLINESLETSITDQQSTETINLNTPQTEKTSVDMMTRYTTYTYFTTFFLQNGTSVASQEVTSTEIVAISDMPFSQIPILTTTEDNIPTPSLQEITTASPGNVQTVTYTFFTTYIRDGHSFISSSEQLMTVAVPIPDLKNQTTNIPETSEPSKPNGMTDHVKTIMNNVTYLTTLFMDNSTSATSNVIVETSFVPIEADHTRDVSGIAESQLTSSVVSEMITATNTYYTTFFLDGSTSVISREETATEVVLKTVPILLTPTQVSKTEPDEVAHAHAVDTDQLAAPQQQFNTFTQFTTFFLNGSSSVTSSIVIVPRESVATGGSNVVESTISPLEPVGRSVKDSISMHSSSSIPSLAPNITESQVLVAILNPLAESSQPTTTFSEFQVIQANADLNIDLLNQSETVKESKFVRNISQLVLNNLTINENSTHLPMMVNEVTTEKSFTKYLLPSSSYPIGELQLPSPVLRTLYTTFTYYTTFYSGEHTLTSTRLETISSVTTDTIKPRASTSTMDNLKSVYTTYTYFTTFIKDGITSITSDESTRTNVITDTSSIQLSSAEITESYPMTKYTTFTYYTTFYDGDTSTTKSHEEIKSTVYFGPETASRIGVSTVKTVTPEQLYSISATPEHKGSASVSSGQQSSPATISTATTFFTTFTYYTTSYKDDQSFITSRLETSSTVITDTTGVTFIPTTATSPTTELKIMPTPSANNASTSDNALTPGANNILTPGANNALTSTTQVPLTSASSSKIGLLSTINSTDIKGGLTTAYVTEVYGTYVNGLYAHIQQTSSSIFVGPDVAIVSSSSPLSGSVSGASVVTPTTLVNLYPTGLVTETSGSIVNGGTVTLFTSRVIGTYIEGTYAQIVESTSRILLGAATASHVQEKTKSTTDDIYKTGLVSTIPGSSEVNSGITTQHETQVLGTYIEGSYAQILQPTTRILTSSITLTSNTLETTKISSNSPLFSIPISTSPLIDSSSVQESNESSPSAIKPTSSRFRPTVRPFNSRLRPNNFFNRKSTSSSLSPAVSVTASAATTSKTRPFARGSSPSRNSGTKSSSGSFRGSSPGFRGSSSQGYRPTNSRNGGRGSSYPGSRSSSSGNRVSSYPGRSSSGRSSSRASGSTKAVPSSRGKFTFRPRNSRFSKSSGLVSSSPYATSSVYYKPSSRGSTAFTATAENSLIEPSFETTPTPPSLTSIEDPEENEHEDVMEETVTVTSTSRVIADKQVSKSTSTNKQNEDENEDTQDENVDKRKVLFRHFRPGQRRPLFPRNRSKNRKDKNLDIDDQKESGSELHEIEAETGQIYVHEFAEDQVSRKKRSPRKLSSSEESGEDYGMKKLYRLRYQRPNRSTISPSKSQTPTKNQSPTKSQSGPLRKITIRARTAKSSSKAKENSQTVPTRTTKNNLRTQTQRRRAKTISSAVSLSDMSTQTTKVRPTKTRSRSRSTKRNSREKFTIRPTATRRSRLTTRNRSDYTRKVVATRRRIGEARHAPRSKSAVSDSWGSGSMKRNKQVIRTPIMPPLITVTHTLNTSKVLTIFHGRETEIRTLPTTSLSEQILRTNDYSTVNEFGKTKFVLESSIVTDILNPTIARITEVIITSSVKPTATISRLRGGGRETKTSTVTLYGVTTVVTESTQLVPLQATNQLASLLLPQLLLNQFFPNQQQQQQLSLTTSYYTHVTTTTVHSSSIIPLVFRGKTKYSTLSERKVYPTTIITSTMLPVTVAPNYQAINPLFPLFNPLQYQLLQPQLQQQQQQQLAPPSAIETMIQPSIVTMDPELYEPEFELESEEEVEVAPPPPPKRETKHPKPERTTPITSVLTLYLSGEKPGQFNSFITTVTLNANGEDDETGRVRRAAGIISKPTDILEMTALPELYDLIGDDETYHQDIRNNANVILVSALTDIDEYGLRKDLETDSLDNYKEELTKNSQDADSQEDGLEDDDGLESDEVDDDEDDSDVEQVSESTIEKRTKRAIDDNEEDEEAEEAEDEEEPEDESEDEDTKLRTYTRYYTRFKDGSHRISSTVETVTRNPANTIQRGFTASQLRGSRVLQTKLFETDEPEDSDTIKPSTPVKLVRQKVSRVRRPVSRKLVRIKPKVTTDSEQQLSTKDSAEVSINNPQLNRLVPKSLIALDVENKDEEGRDENQDDDSEEEDYEEEIEETSTQPTFTMSEVENSFTSEETTPKVSRSRVKLIRVRPSAASNTFGSKRIISSRRVKVPIRGTVSNKLSKPISMTESTTADKITSKTESPSHIKGSRTRTRLFPTHPIALTYYTTFTYFSTLISDGITQMRSREAITSVVTTEPLNTRVASIIQTSAGYSMPVEEARLTNFGTRTRKGVTTIVNAGSRIRVSDGGILPTLPPSEHVIKVKPTERPIVTSINGRRHGVGPGDAPRTYLTIYTYYYTFIDESETKYSSSEATHRELVRGSTKPLPENFQRTEDSFGLYTLNTDSPLTNLGFRVLGDRTTSVNLGDKTIVMFGNVPMSATSTKLLTDNPTILSDFSTTSSSPSRIFATRTRVLRPKGSRYKVLRTRVKPSSQPPIESSFELETTEEPIFESSIKLPDDEIESESTFQLESSFETEVSHEATTSESPEVSTSQSVVSTPALPLSTLSSSKFRYQSTRGSSFRGSSSSYPSSSSSSTYSRRGFGSRKPFTRVRSSSSKPLPSNVVYVTYTTTTLVPFLGGTHTRTLNVVTSSLRTLAPEELAELTASQQQSSTSDDISAEIETTDSTSDTNIQSTLQSSQLSSQQSSTFPTSSSSSSPSSSIYSLTSSIFSSSKFPSSSSNVHPFLSSSKSFTSPYSTLSRLSPSSVQSSLTELETTRTVLETLTTTYTYIITRLDGTSQVVSTKEESTTEVVTKTLTETVTSTLSLFSTFVVPLPVDVTSKPPLNISDINTNNDVRNLSTTSTSSEASTSSQLKTELLTKVMPDGVTLLVAGSSSEATPIIASESPRQQLTSLIPQKTIYTTFTYFTTFFEGGNSRVVSREEISSSVMARDAVPTATPPLLISSTPLQTPPVEVSEVAHTPGITETLFTTYTYLHLFKTENAIHTVTSKSTTFNTLIHASESSIPSRLTLLETKTSSSTNTFYSTTYEGSNEVVTSAEEVVTQIIITRAPFLGVLSITPTPTTATTTLIEASSNDIALSDKNVMTKTYLTTFTYYTSFLEGSNVITSSNFEVITNTVKQPVESSPSITYSAITTSSIPSPVLTSSLTQPSQYNVKTYFTTYTYYTTYFDGTGTSISSREETQSNVVSDVITPSLSSSLLRSVNTTLPIPTQSANFVEIQPTSPFETQPTKAPDVIRVRTYFTTFTSYTTLIDGSNTVINSKIDIKSSIETILPTRLHSQPSTSVASPTTVVSGSTIIFFNDIKNSNEKQASLLTSSSSPVPVFTPSPSTSMRSTSVSSLTTTNTPIVTHSRPQPASGNNAAIGSGGNSFLSGVAPILGGLAAAFLSSGGMNAISNRNDTDKNIHHQINSPQIPSGVIVPAAQDPIFIPLQQPAQHHNVIPIVVPQNDALAPPPNDLTLIQPSSFTAHQVNNAFPAAPIYQGDFKPGVTEKGFTPIFSSAQQIEENTKRQSISTVTSVFQGQSTLFFNRPQQEYKPSIATFTLQGSGSDDEYVTAPGRFKESVIDGRTMVLALHPENTNDRVGFHTVTPSIDHMIGAAAETKDQSVLALASINDFELPSKVTTVYTTYTYFTTLFDKGESRVVSREETVSQVKTQTLFDSVELLTSSLVLHIEQPSATTTRKEIRPTIVLGQKDSSERLDQIQKININRNDILPGTSPDQFFPQQPSGILVQVPQGGFIPVSPGHSFQIPVQNEQFINVPGAVTQQIAGIEFAPQRPTVQTRMLTYTHYTTFFSNGRRVISSHEQIIPTMITISPTATQQSSTNTLFISIANGESEVIPAVLGVHPGIRTTTQFVPAKTVDSFPFNLQISSIQQNIQDTRTLITDKIDVDHSTIAVKPTQIHGTRLLTFTHYTTFTQNGRRTVSSREEIITQTITDGIAIIQQSTVLGTPVIVPSSQILDFPSSVATSKEPISVQPIGVTVKDKIDEIKVSIQPSPTLVTPSQEHTVDQNSLLHVLSSLHNVIEDKENIENSQKKSDAFIPIHFTLDPFIDSKSDSGTKQPLLVTFTHFTTLFQNGASVISSREEVVSQTMNAGHTTREDVAVTRQTTTKLDLDPPTMLTNAVTSIIASRPVIHVGNFPLSDTLNISEAVTTTSTALPRPGITTFTSAKFTPTTITLGTIVSSSVEMQPITPVPSFQSNFALVDGSIPPEIRTYYTTYTYYTSYLKDRSIPIVSSRKETVTRVSTVPVSTIKVTSAINTKSEIDATTNVVVAPTSVSAQTVYRTRTIFFTTFLGPGRSSIYSSSEIYGVIIPPQPTRIVWYQDGEVNVNRTDGNQFQSTMHVSGQILSSGIFGNRTVLYVVNTDFEGSEKTTTVDNTHLQTTLINGQQTLFIQQTAQPSVVTQTTQNEVIVTASATIEQGFISPSSVETKTSVKIGSSVNIVEHNGAVQSNVQDTPELSNSVNLLGINTKPTVLIGGIPPGTKEETKTTSIGSGSTIVSGTKTVFGEVFTRPLDTSTEITYSNDERLVTNKGVVTRYITYVDSTERTIAQTTPTTIGLRSTNIVNINTYPRRTMVITVLGDKTVINYVNAQQQPLDATDMLKIFGTKVTLVPAPTTTRGPDEASVLVQAGFGNGFGANKPQTTTQKAKVESKEDDGISQSDRIKANGNEDQCKPSCNVLQGEVCREIGPSNYRCVCRTGFFRPSFSNTCRGVRNYLAKVVLVSMARNPLQYSVAYTNKNSNEFNQVSSKSKQGVDEILKSSNAVGRYYYNDKVKTLTNARDVGAQQGLLANIVVQVGNNSAVDETMLQKELIQYLNKNDYTLGSTDLKTSPSANAITVEDFDECADGDFNDCSSNAICKNTMGSYTCSCKDQYLDDDSRFPGRICLEASSPCDFCSYHGVCAQGEDGHRYCKCDKWYLGKNCQVNGYALAIILPIIIGLLLIAILLWLCCCCRKGRCCVAGSCCDCCEPRPRTSAAARAASGGVFPILNSGVAGTGGTLDKKAMIAGDTSSESSGEQSRLAHVADVFGGGGTHKSGKSASSYEDRSISALVTEPPVLIPRAKHQHPKQYISASTENILPREDTADYMGAENKLMSILDGEARHERNMAIQKESSSFATLPTAMSKKSKASGGRHEGKKTATQERGLRGESRMATSSNNLDASSGYTKFSTSTSASKAERLANASSGHHRSTNKASASANAAAASATLSQDISSQAAKKKYGLRGKGASTMHVISSNNYLNSNDLVREAESAFSHGDTSSRPTATYSSNRDAADFENFSSRFETASTGQYGNTATMSMARSFDETTIHPERRGVGSYYSSSKDRSMRFFREEPYQTDMDEAITDMSTMRMSANQMLYEHDSDASGSSNPSAILPKVHRRGGGEKKYETSYYNYESKKTSTYNHT